MQGILILAHGSRAEHTKNTLKTIVEPVREKLTDKIIQTAFMQFDDMNIDKGLTALMEKGATEIKVIPYFLFDGVHIHEDIPNEIAEFTKKHPSVSITLGKTLGTDPRLSDILVDRITS